MATLRQRKDSGAYEIQFQDEHRRKRTITLSGKKFTKDFAKDLKKAVEVLIHEKLHDAGIPHRKTQLWIENAPLEIQEKLATVGLYKLLTKHTVKELWDLFFEKHSFRNDKTWKSYVHTKERFFLFFKPNEFIDDLTAERMKEWKHFLLNDQGYAVATVAGTIQKAKAVFNWAKDKSWITASPLDGVGRGSYRNKEKDRIVTPGEYGKLLDACLDQDWRVIITLARIGGLRPCEILVLKWEDIHWDRNFFTVYSPKLKGHKRYEREVPLFPEVVAELKKLRAIPGNENQEYVVNRYNREKSNFGCPFDRISKRAGIGKIDRPFDNMRMSRANEIRPVWGTKLENLWIGHSAKVADEFYYTATETDYAIAAGKIPSDDQTGSETRFTAQITDASNGCSDESTGKSPDEEGRNP